MDVTLHKIFKLFDSERISDLRKTVRAALTVYDIDCLREFDAEVQALDDLLEELRNMSVGAHLAIMMPGKRKQLAEKACNVIQRIKTCSNYDDNMTLNAAIVMFIERQLIFEGLNVFHFSTWPVFGRDTAMLELALDRLGLTSAEEFAGFVWAKVARRRHNALRPIAAEPHCASRCCRLSKRQELPGTIESVSGDLARYRAA